MRAFRAGGAGAATAALDRAALGRIVFADPAALRDLEAIVHPAVRPAHPRGDGRRGRAAGAPAVVIEAIKLVEGGLAELCDEVWLVTCEASVQRARVVARGATPADADARIAAQAGLAERVAPIASRIVDTSGSVTASRHAVADAWSELIDQPGSQQEDPTASGSITPVEGA